MKQSKKFGIILILFVSILAIAILGYNYLSSNYVLDDSVSVNGGNQTNVTNSTLASDFTVLDYDGNEVQLSQSFGKPTIVNFWATWCGPCKSEMVAFENIYGEYSTTINFMMVNLTDGSRDTVSGVKTFVENGAYTFPVYFDTTYSAATAYNVMSIPTTLFINSDGTIMKTHVGAMSESTLRNYISALLSQ